MESTREMERLVLYFGSVMVSPSCSLAGCLITLCGYYMCAAVRLTTTVLSFL